MKTMYKRIVTLILLGFALANWCSAGWAIETARESWQVMQAAQPEITIMDNVLRPDYEGQLFGFNINFRQFQTQLWSSNQAPKEGIVDALRPFEGAFYRYPGGSVANSFHWTAAVGPLRTRQAQSSFYERQPAKVRFGIDEFFDFIEDVNGKPWYVANIVGTDLYQPLKLADLDEMAYSNLKLTEYLLEKVEPDLFPLPFQLGNEVDRSRYEWSAELYAERAKAVIDVLEKNNLGDQFNFVNFMRDFRWTYKKDKSRGQSKAKDYLQDVIGGLGRVNDYSLHHYYDGAREDGKSRSIPFWFRHLSRSINDHKMITNKPATIWITEHGRQPNSNRAGKDNSVISTSNVAAGISTADYLIGLSQFPEVKGAVWHGLNAGPWQLFDYSVKHKDLRPRPIYWALRVLKVVSLDQSLATFSSSPNTSGYAGNYDIRGAAFRSDNGQTLGLRAVNRAQSTHKVKLRYEQFKNKTVELKHYSLSLPELADPEVNEENYILELEPKPKAVKFDDKGYIYIDLPPSSVSSILMQ